MKHPLYIQTELVFSQLSKAILAMDNLDYTKPLDSLSGSSIGQHVRHIIEFYQCLLKGCSTNLVDYDARERDKRIEEKKDFALNCIEKIAFELQHETYTKQLLLNVVYTENTSPLTLSTTLERELVYNIEHSIHHMAIIKIGIKELNQPVELSSSFGVASSTLRFQRKNVCAQ